MDERPSGRKPPDFPTEMGEFICPVCGRNYSTLEELHTHVRRVHRTPPEVNGLPLGDRAGHLPGIE